MLALPTTTAPLLVAAQPGQTLTLKVTLPPAASGVLLTHEAPNTLTLVTPWGQQSAGLRGKPLSAPAELRGYFASVEPLWLGFKLPASVKPGTYSGQVRGQLFTCDRRENICQQRKVSYPLQIRVGEGGGNNVLNVQVSSLRGKS